MKDEPVFTRQCYALKFDLKVLKNHKAGKQKGGGGKEPQTLTSKPQKFYLYNFLKNSFCIGQSEQCLTKLCKEKRAKHTNCLHC